LKGSIRQPGLGFHSENIAVSADVTTVDVEKCQAVGMNDYLSKPIDEKVLHSKIVELIKKSRVY